MKFYLKRKSKKKTRKPNSWPFIFVLLYRLSLDWIYGSLVSVSFRYYGFFNNINPASYIASIVVLYLCFIYVRKIFNARRSGILTYTIVLLFLMSFVPFTVLFGFGYDWLFSILNSIFSFLIFFLTYIFMDKRKIKTKTKIKTSKASMKFVFTIGFLFSLVTIYVSFRYSGFRLNFDLSKIYEVRLLSFENDLSWVVSHLFSWSRTIVSIILCYALIKRKYVYALFFTAVQLLSFGYDGMKSTLFFILISFVVGLLYRRRFNFAMLGTLGLTAITVVGMVEYLSIETHYIMSYFHFRTLFLPNLISDYFVDFFSTHNPDFLRQGILRHLGFVSEYSEDINYMISRIYFNDPGRANNGLIGDAMSNFGYFGLVLYPVVFSLFLKLCDSISRNIDCRILVISSFHFVIDFSNVSFIVCLFSNGIIVIMVLFLILNTRVKIKHRVKVELISLSLQGATAE